MKKTYISLGILVLLISLTSARAELLVSPETQSTCCDVLRYDVSITNPFNVQRAFTLKAEIDSEDIWISLEPELILLPPEESETLTLFVRPNCDMESGEYTIKVSSECGICESYIKEAEVTLNIDNCIIQEPLEPDEPEEEPEIPDEPEVNQSQDDSPTGAAVSSEKDSLILIVFALLIVTILVILALIKKK